MADDGKKVSLPMGETGEDRAGRVMREKIGDVRELGAARGGGAGMVVEGVTAADQKALEEKIVAVLRTIFDPEIPLNIYDLGLIYKLSIDAVNAVKVEMTLTAPGCPVAGAMVEEVRRKVDALPEVSRVEVELVWEPPWTRERLSEAARLELGM